MLSLLLAVLAPGRPLPPASPTEARGIATDLRARPDAARIAAYPGLAHRDGRVLHIGKTRFVDEGAACDGSGCLRYRFDRPWFGGYVDVSVFDDENSDYLLVYGRNGTPIYIGDTPHPSPSGRLFFVGMGSEANDESIGGVANGSYVWEVETLRRLRTVDDAIVHFERFVEWRGDQCVEFTGWTTGGLGTPSHSYWLIRERLDWVLHDEPSRACMMP